VVIAIIGILSSLIVVSIKNSINSANDARRKQDVDSIRKVLSVYGALNFGVYPIQTTQCNIGPTGTTNRCANVALISDLASPPVDPISGYYSYISDGSSFTIFSTLSSGSVYGYNSATKMSALYTVVQFTTVGTSTWTVPAGVNIAEVLIVAGGGGAANGNTSGGGGGGGGGVLTGVLTGLSGSYSITVGAGGIHAAKIISNSLLKYHFYFRIFFLNASITFSSSSENAKQRLPRSFSEAPM